MSFNITRGQSMMVTIGGVDVQAKYMGWNHEQQAGNFEYKGRVHIRKLRHPVTGEVIRECPHEIEFNKFSIAERFQFLEDFTDMTVVGGNNALVVAGEGGLGKSWTIKYRLDNAGLKEIEMDDKGNKSIGDYEFVKGHSTPKAMYRSLYDNREGIVIYDDCDAVLKNDQSVNILKGALDSYDKRVISWMTEIVRDEELPQRFEFKGKVIFLSNMDLKRIPQPLLSRAMYVDVSMSTHEKFERMRAIAPKIDNGIDQGVKLQLIDFLEKIADGIGDLNMRTFNKACVIVKQYPDTAKWQQRVEYLVTAL